MLGFLFFSKEFMEKKKKGAKSAKTKKSNPV